MKKIHKRVLISFALIVSIMFSTEALAAATSAGSGSSASNTGRTASTQRLKETKLKVCQNRESAIHKRSESLTSMAKNMEIKFDHIASRVETYYTEKSVPAGRVVADYDQLIAAIQAKKDQVALDLAKANSDSSLFSCNGDDPKGQIQLFHDDMKNVKKALKEYRAAINDLIVSVRSANGEQNSSSSGSISTSGNISSGQTAAE